MAFLYDWMLSVSGIKEYKVGKHIIRSNHDILFFPKPLCSCNRNLEFRVSDSETATPVLNELWDRQMSCELRTWNISLGSFVWSAIQLRPAKEGLQAAEPAYVKQSRESDLTMYEEKFRTFDYVSGQWPTWWRSPIRQWAVNLGSSVLVTDSERGTNKPLGTTKSFIKSQIP